MIFVLARANVEIVENRICYGVLSKRKLNYQTRLLYFREMKLYYNLSDNNLILK